MGVDLILTQSSFETANVIQYWLLQGIAAITIFITKNNDISSKRHDLLSTYYMLLLL